MSVHNVPIESRSTIGAPCKKGYSIIPLYRARFLGYEIAVKRRPA
jgi:hypothetical protein